MNYIITVDGGTSNTRTYLWTANGQILTQRSQAIGAKTSAINGSNQAWKKAIHNMIESMLTECAVSDNAIQGVYMSGMLTSDLGILEGATSYCSCLHEKLSGASDTCTSAGSILKRDRSDSRHKKYTFQC